MIKGQNTTRDFLSRSYPLDKCFSSFDLSKPTECSGFGELTPLFPTSVGDNLIGVLNG